jgi:3-deoxy-D-manno-octulosonic-acid transferase
MFVILYNVFLALFKAGTFIFSLFNVKAKKWVAGRKDIFKKLELAIPANEKIIWMHCASLGEFEQGRPVLENIRSKYPTYKIVLTFFSPSGYEVQKNYAGADWVFYLPMDGATSAKRFLDIVHPSLVIFVKYEFWYYYLKKIKYRDISLLLISAVFRRDMSSFKWFGRFQLKMLSRFDHIFLQNEASKKLLDEFTINKNYSIAGDTRFDRVIEIADNFNPVEAIEKFCAGKKIIVAGSTWPEDEDILGKAFETILALDMKLIIAPHEISEKHLADLKKLFPESIVFSSLNNEYSIRNTNNCLVIDNYGMLSRLYKYANISFVGGGFRIMGVHNVTEAAVYGKPVVMGPYISKYREAVELVERKGGFIVTNAEELSALFKELISNKNDSYINSSRAAYNYIRENAGAVKKILDYIQVNRLLTN